MWGKRRIRQLGIPSALDGSCVQDMNARFILDWRFASKENIVLSQAYYDERSRQEHRRADVPAALIPEGGDQARLSEDDIVRKEEYFKSDAVFRARRRILEFEDCRTLGSRSEDHDSCMRTTCLFTGQPILMWGFC
jgi:hypothetical protein